MTWTSDPDLLDRIGVTAHEKDLGRKLNEAEAKFYRHPRDETLSSSLNYRRGRTQDYEPLLSSIVGIVPVGEVVARALEGTVALIRSLIFNGIEVPPFDSFEAALGWIAQEQSSRQAVANLQSEREWVASGKTGPPRSGWLNRSRLIRQARRRLKIDSPPELWVPPMLAIVPKSLEGSNTVPEARLNKGLPGQVTDPGGIWSLVQTAQVALLAAFSSTLGDISKCWSAGQATAFILTGEVPDVPLLRVWIDEVPGGAKRVFLEINGPFGSQDLQVVQRILREANGWGGRKLLTGREIALLALVEQTRERSWAERFDLWRELQVNDYAEAESMEGAPRRRINSPTALRMAYSRAKKRSGS